MFMDVRASDAERDATVDRLREAAAEGRLTFEELADRIELAANAVTRAELVPLTADLPTARTLQPAEPIRVRMSGDIKRSGA
jgi:ribosome-binding protein aMBF1 (putative translation factor)